MAKKITVMKTRIALTMPVNLTAPATVQKASEAYTALKAAAIEAGFTVEELGSTFANEIPKAE